MGYQGAYTGQQIDDRLGKVPGLESGLAAAQTDITALFNAVGSPLVASTAAGMTDKTKIYVYTGSETGYTAGNWYYWDSSLSTPAWTSGGVYNSMAIDTDKRLETLNKAADAKATGEIRNQLARLNSFDFFASITNKPNKTSAGVTFTWNADKSECTVSGTSTGNPAFDTFYTDHFALIAGVEAGKTYTLDYSGENVYFQFYFYDANEEVIENPTFHTVSDITIPAEAVGMAARLCVAKNKVASETVSPRLLTGKSNGILAEEISELQDDLEENVEEINSVIDELETRLTEYIPVDVAANLSTPSKTHGGVTYTYSNGNYTVSGTATAIPSFCNLYSNNASLPSNVEPGDLLYVKFLGEDVSLRFAWRSSGGTTIARAVIRGEQVITVPANADGAIIRLEVLYGTTVNETFPYPVILAGIPAEYLYNEIETLKDANARQLKVLVFGSSFSYSTLGLLPELMKEATPGLNFTMGLLYQSGYGLQGHINFFNEDTVYSEYSEYKSDVGAWDNTADEITARNALDRYEWDVIVLQNNSSEGTSTYLPLIEQLADLISGYIEYPVDFMLNITQARGAANDTGLNSYTGSTTLEKSNSMFTEKATFAETALEGWIIKDVLPGGTAVQNFRNSTDTSEIGTEGSGYLCDDNKSHLRNGIGPLVAGYAAMMKLLDYAGEKTKSFNLPLAPTDAWLKTFNLWTRSSHGACVGVTDENRLLGQKCALAAVKNPFEITSVTSEE